VALVPQSGLKKAERFGAKNEALFLTFLRPVGSKRHPSGCRALRSEERSFFFLLSLAQRKKQRDIHPNQALTNGRPLSRLDNA
jgi:hypothetical protein